MAGLFRRRKLEISDKAKAEHAKRKKVVKNTSRTEQIADSLRQAGMDEADLARLGYRRSR